jgi:catechol 2,3-dioxygenase-like lactoylglutathione lyase family enzyme
MSMHRLTDFTMGVPNVAEAVEYYTQFGLVPVEPTPEQNDHWFGTVDGGGRQMRIVPAPVRKLFSVGIGVDDRDDLERIASSLRRLDVDGRVEGDQLMTKEPVTGLDIIVSVASRIKQESTPTPQYNSPGNVVRANARAMPMAQRRPEPVRPRRLGHVSIGTTDKEASQRFFTTSGTWSPSCAAAPTTTTWC